MFFAALCSSEGHSCRLVEEYDMMNGNVDENQGLHIPENLLQEATTASHVTGTPRSTGLFDYFSRAANSAATILQARAPSYLSNAAVENYYT